MHSTVICVRVYGMVDIRVVCIECGYPQLCVVCTHVCEHMLGNVDVRVYVGIGDHKCVWCVSECVGGHATDMKYFSKRLKSLSQASESRSPSCEGGFRGQDNLPSQCSKSVSSPDKHQHGGRHCP